MKRADLIRHLEAHGCRFVREGGNHTIYSDGEQKKLTALPRHREINNITVKNICKDLDIPAPKKK